MVMPKLPLSYEAALAQLPKGFNFVCTGCKETFTVYPKGEAFTYNCWCGVSKQFTGREVNVNAI